MVLIRTGGSRREDTVVTGKGVAVEVRPRLGTRTTTLFGSLKVSLDATANVFCQRTLEYRKLPFRIGISRPGTIACTTVRTTRGKRSVCNPFSDIMSLVRTLGTWTKIFKTIRAELRTYSRRELQSRRIKKDSRTIIWQTTITKNMSESYSRWFRGLWKRREVSRQTKLTINLWDYSTSFSFRVSGSKVS